MLRYFSVVLILFFQNSLHAKPKDHTFWVGAHYWNAGSMKGQTLMASKQWQRKAFHLHHQVGFGFAFTRNRPAYRGYITAPSILRHGGTGPSHWFGKNMEENMDTLFAGQHVQYSLNLFFHGNLKVYKQFSVGLETDLIGFSFGRREQALLNYGDDGDFNQVYMPASPTSMNINIPGSGKVGNCQFRIFLQYFVTPRCAIGLGGLHQTNEFMVLQPVNYINSLNVNVNTGRYRFSSLGWLLRVNYKL